MTRATMTPAKLSLLAGAAMMLAAFPAFAQTSTQTGNTTGGAPTTTAAPGQSSGSSMSPHPGMGPKSSTGGSGSGMHASSTHQGRSMHQAMRGGRTDTSQNATVDRLNEQSYQAAQQGQAFMPGSSSGAPAGGMGMSPGGGSMGQPNPGMPPQGSGKM